MFADITPVCAIGAMRLSTISERDDERGVAVLHAAFDAGVRVVDTADVYCWNERDIGHNERLIAQALRTWSGGDRASVVVATKGGLIRPDGGWRADGRARHLLAACEASLRALDVPRLALYQLHAPDPRVPLATSARALAALARDGRVAAVGLCNVSVQQIEIVRQHVDVASVQVELSLWNDTSVLGGVAAYCLAHGITLLAYRPLGGAQPRRRWLASPVLDAVAARTGLTPAEVALAWYSSLPGHVVPLPGPTRVETARSAAHGRRATLDAADLASLGAAFPAARYFPATAGERSAPAALAAPPVEARVRTEAGPVGDREVVLIVGLPGAGKSTLARQLEGEGYERLNRDDAGGRLADLLPVLDARLAAGARRVVLDNTYLTRAARAAVLRTAKARHVNVRCVWLTTSVEDAQINAVNRMLAAYHRLLTPDELNKTGSRDPAIFGPGAQFRAQRTFEAPRPDEGFARVDEVAFVRRAAPDAGTRAVVIWCDGLLLRSRSGQRAPTTVSDVDIDQPLAAALRRHVASGWRVLGLSWQPTVADGQLAKADLDAVNAHARAAIDPALTLAVCPHPAGPPICWCRKPLPGLVLAFAADAGVDLGRSVYVGNSPQDPGFARRLGMRFEDAAAFAARTVE